MSLYLMIESRDVSESCNVADFLDSANSLADAGHEVHLYLIQNGVFLARSCANASISSLACNQGISLWADDFSLKDRSIAPNSINRKIQITSIGTLTKLLAHPGCKAIWH